MKQRKNMPVGRKLDQVRVGTQAIFLRDGYADASVDDIAEAAGVSKATLYAYFPDKSLMFKDAILAMKESHGPGPFGHLDMGLTPKSSVLRIFLALSDWFAMPHQKRLFRLTVSESEKFPELSDVYSDLIDTRLLAPLTRWLDQWAARGELDIDNTTIAARQMISLCHADAYITSFAGRDELARRRMAENSAEMFLRAHRPAHTLDHREPGQPAALKTASVAPLR